MKFDTAITTKLYNGHNLSMESNLKLIKDAGFQSVMPDETPQIGLREFILAAKKNSLKIPYVHLSADLINSIWKSNRDETETVVKDKKHSIKLCGEAGINTVVLHTLSVSDEIKNYRPSSVALKPFEQILQTAEKENVRIALENGNKEDMRFIDYLMKEFDSPHLGVCFDSGHDKLFDRNQEIVHKYGKKLYAIHLHDNPDWKFGSEPDFRGDVHQIPFDGTGDFEKIIALIAKTPYNGPITLESKHRITKPDSIYNKMTPQEFLERAFQASQKLAKMHAEAKEHS